MFEALLAKAGYVPAAEKAAVVADGARIAVALAEMTIARNELALRLADTRDDLESANKRIDQLQAEVDRVYGQHQDLVLKYDQLVIESRTKDDTISDLTQAADEANTFIAQLQSERPQMRLVRNEKPIAAGEEANNSAAPAEDEVIVAEHTVTMTARVVIVAFEGKTHWTLSVDDHQFKAAVHDRAFLDDPDHKFAKGSLVRAEFFETMLRRRGDGEPYTLRSLERVIEVIQPSPQTTQPMFADAATASERI
jgi:uncharacterized protein YoxC